MTKKAFLASMPRSCWPFPPTARANKTSVAVMGPDAVAAGTEVTLTISVTHKGNSVFHHTNWVVVKADGAEIARWDFKARACPKPRISSGKSNTRSPSPWRSRPRATATSTGARIRSLFKIAISEPRRR